MTNYFKPIRVTLFGQPKAWWRYVAVPLLWGFVRWPFCLTGRHRREEYWTYPNGIRDRSVRLCTPRCRDCWLKLP